MAKIIHKLPLFNLRRWEGKFRRGPTREDARFPVKKEGDRTPGERTLKPKKNGILNHSWGDRERERAGAERADHTGSLFHVVSRSGKTTLTCLHAGGNRQGR